MISTGFDVPISVLILQENAKECVIRLGTDDFHFMALNNIDIQLYVISEESDNVTA